jgi:hypothetical protein
MRKRIVLGIGLLGCLGLVALVAVPRLVGLRPGVTVDNFRRLHPGMPEQEVAGILGRPGEQCEPGEPSWNGIYCRRWSSTSCVVEVWFIGGVAQSGEAKTEDGLVQFLPDSPPPLWDRFRRLMPW